jgi:hypothetical protein
MTRQTFLAACLCLFVLPLSLHAQDNDMGMAEEAGPPSFLMFNQSQIPGEQVSAYNHLVDSLMRPVMNALVDEGLVATWGYLNHAWGDEWNWAWFMYTKDHAAFLKAWSEVVKRVADADSTSWSQLTKPVKRHRDNLYHLRHLKSRESVEGEDPARFVMLNHHIVEMSDLAAANALVDSTTAVVLDQMVDDGIIHYWGQANHSWGDEWNLNFYFSSDSHADFVSDWAEFVKRMSEQFPDTYNEWAKLSKAHKDNLYSIIYRY